MSLCVITLSFYSKNSPDESCDILFEEAKWKVLYMLANKTQDPPLKPYPIKDAAKWLAELDGLRRAPSDGAPGGMGTPPRPRVAPNGGRMSGSAPNRA
jgi:hypothetical protein